MAAAVILPARGRPQGLADSKQLSAPAREALALQIRACALVGVGIASALEIDQINILRATHLAMRRAFDALCVAAGARGSPAPQAALIDGNSAPDLPCALETIVDGDAHVPLISAASIIAKVDRDALMGALADRYPGYAFAQHKGYGTPEHQRALAALGPCAEHRMTFKPVRAAATRFAAGDGPA